VRVKFNGSSIEWRGEALGVEIAGWPAAKREMRVKSKLFDESRPASSHNVEAEYSNPRVSKLGFLIGQFLIQILTKNGGEKNSKKISKKNSKQFLRNFKKKS